MKLTAFLICTLLISVLSIRETGSRGCLLESRSDRDDSFPLHN